MKRLLLLLILPYVFKGQDTIFKKDNTTIICKITKVTSSMLFYTENKIGKSISISDISKYSNQQTNNSTSSSNTQESDVKCDFKVTYDKFESDTTYTLEFAEWLNVYKVKKKGKVVYFMRLVNEGVTANYLKKGIIIMLSDGSKIEKPEEKIDCKFRAGTMYDFTAFFRLTPEDLDLLSKNRMTDWRLYIYDRSLNEKRGEKLRQQILCLIKS